MCNLLKSACIQLEPCQGWLDCPSPSIVIVLSPPLAINTKLRQGGLSFVDMWSLISEGWNLFSAPCVISVTTWFHPSHTSKLFFIFVEITPISRVFFHHSYHVSMNCIVSWNLGWTLHQRCRHVWCSEDDKVNDCAESFLFEQWERDGGSQGGVVTWS